MNFAKTGKRRLGRPRDQGAQRAILEAALKLVSVRGFRAITMDQIATEANVGKMTVYRRWPNKGALVMNALLELVGPETAFPTNGPALDRLRQQLELQAKFFRGPRGMMIRSLLGEAQSDSELATAFRDNWIKPRRLGVMKTLQDAIKEGRLRSDIELETAIDLLYGPLYYRLLIGTMKIDKAFIQSLCEQFLNGHCTPKAG